MQSKTISYARWARSRDSHVLTATVHANREIFAAGQWRRRSRSWCAARPAGGRWLVLPSPRRQSHAHMCTPPPLPPFSRGPFPSPPLPHGPPHAASSSPSATPATSSSSSSLCFSPPSLKKAHTSGGGGRRWDGADRRREVSGGA